MWQAVVRTLVALVAASAGLFACAQPSVDSSRGAGTPSTASSMAVAPEPASIATTGAAPSPSESVALPSSWPSDVPVYHAGTLVMAMVSPTEGTADAIWRLSQPPQVAIAQTRAALEAAGYRVESQAIVDGVTMVGLVGAAHRIALAAGPIDGAPTLTLSVRSAAP